MGGYAGLHVPITVRVSVQPRFSFLVTLAAEGGLPVASSRAK